MHCLFINKSLIKSGLLSYFYLYFKYEKPLSQRQKMAIIVKNTLLSPYSFLFVGVVDAQNAIVVVNHGALL